MTRLPAGGNLSQYEIFAPYYRSLLKDRGHFEDQLKLLIPIIEHEKSNVAVLDAACGTGEVLLGLLDEGFNAFGLDGSPAMLAQAGSLVGVQHRRRLYPPCPWEEIAFQRIKRRFECVFILGNAFSHLAHASIPPTLNRIHDILTPNGLFVFDMRHWAHDKSGTLRQPGRKIGEPRQHGPYVDRGKQFLINETCRYTHLTQVISYDVHHLDTGKGEPALDCRFELRYSLFDSDDVIRWAEESDFRSKPVLHVPNVDGWPYQVVSIRKSHLEFGKKRQG